MHKYEYFNTHHLGGNSQWICFGGCLETVLLVGKDLKFQVLNRSVCVSYCTCVLDLNIDCGCSDSTIACSLIMQNTWALYLAIFLVIM
jgi:hypothetical protein